MKIDNNFFKKHQRVLLKIANNPLMFWFFGFNKLPSEIKKQVKKHKVDRITTSSLRVGGEEHFFTRRLFAKKLAENTSPFSSLEYNKEPVYSFNPVGALLAIATIFIAPAGFGFMGTVTDFEQTTGNWGDVRRDASVSWVDTRTGAGTQVDTTYFEISSRFISGSRYVNHRVWLGDIDTSTIGTDTVSSAVLYLKKDPIAYADNDSLVLHVVPSTRADGDSISTDDYQSFTNTSQGSRAFADFGTAHETITLTSSIVDKTGKTKIAFITNKDLNNSEPTESSYMYAFVKTGADEPYIKVTYAAGVAATPRSFAVII